MSAVKNKKYEHIAESIKIEDSSDYFVPEGYQMIFNDEFDNGLDLKKWNIEEGYFLDPYNADTFGWGNKELEFYAKENVSVAEGNLNINLKREKKTFHTIGEEKKERTARFSSGKITTKKKFSFKYGRVDVRAKFPRGVGIWPAIWMLAENSPYGYWPRSGEIDIAEGRGRMPNMVWGTLHYGVWPNHVENGDSIDLTNAGNKKTDTGDWHVYSVIWEKTEIKIYCDGKCYFKSTNEEWGGLVDEKNINAPFDVKFYLIINLACGGIFDRMNEPDDSFESANMYVDYVRVYKRI